jgi:hypothetical protein
VKVPASFGAIKDAWVKEFANGAAKHWFKHAIKLEPRESPDLR